eukprot:GGOE01041698.1.p1 GENE.GGOE01041698.1~~GGOE01041698.1.p1  ORF type:complete len:418 (-),score=139.55 GGOE01041698.1:338-1555(-)
MSAEDVSYLAESDIPLMLNDLCEELLRFKPLTPRKCITSQLQRMVLDGRTRRPERKLIYFVGGPASGKGTLAKLLCKHFGSTIVTVGAGDLLREEVARGTAQGKMIESIMVEGKIVPAHITIGLLKATIEALPATVKWILIDGFPRAMDQGWAFEKTLGVGLPEFMLCFHCPDELMFKRMVDRGATSGRADDNEATARKRIANHHAKSVPCIEYYRSQGLLYDVDASAEASITWPMVLPLFIEPQDLPEMIFLVGGTASARTAAQKAADQQKCGYIAFPEVLKAEAGRNNNTPSMMVRQLLTDRHPIPMSIALNLLRRALHQAGPVKRVLVEGFPATIGDVLESERRFKPCSFAIRLPPRGQGYTAQEQSITAYYDVQGLLRSLPDNVSAATDVARMTEEIARLL